MTLASPCDFVPPLSSALCPYFSHIELLAFPWSNWVVLCFGARASYLSCNVLASSLSVTLAHISRNNSVTIVKLNNSYQPSLSPDLRGTDYPLWQQHSLICIFILVLIILVAFVSMSISLFLSLKMIRFLIVWTEFMSFLPLYSLPMLNRRSLFTECLLAE